MEQRRAARLVIREGVRVRAVVLCQAQSSVTRQEPLEHGLTEVGVECHPGRLAGVGVVEGTRAAVRVVHYHRIGLVVRPFAENGRHALTAITKTSNARALATDRESSVVKRTLELSRA